MVSGDWSGNVAFCFVFFFITVYTVLIDTTPWGVYLDFPVRQLFGSLF